MGPVSRFVIGLSAVPAILLAFLSLALLVVSILALLVLTLPVLSLLMRLSGSGTSGRVMGSPAGYERSTVSLSPSPGAKKVDSTVVE